MGKYVDLSGNRYGVYAPMKRRLLDEVEVK